MAQRVMPKYCSEIRLKARGDVRLWVDGREWHARNLVLAGTAHAASLCLTGLDQPISQVKYGDSAEAPDALQTGPSGSFGVVQVQSVAMDGEEIEVHFSIGSTDNEVSTIRELVLCAGEVALARVVVAPEIPKSAKVQIAGEWRIQLEVSGG